MSCFRRYSVILVAVSTSINAQRSLAQRQDWFPSSNTNLNWSVGQDWSPVGVPSSGNNIVIGNPSSGTFADGHYLSAVAVIGNPALSVRSLTLNSSTVKNVYAGIGTTANRFRIGEFSATGDSVLSVGTNVGSGGVFLGGEAAPNTRGLMTLEVPYSNQRGVDVAAGKSLFLSSFVTGTGGFVKTGPGTFLFGAWGPSLGQSDFAGGVTINAGKVNFNTNAASPLVGPIGTGTITINGGGILEGTGTNVTNSFRWTLSNAIEVGATGGAIRAASISNAATFSGNATVSNVAFGGALSVVANNPTITATGSVIFGGNLSVGSGQVVTLDVSGGFSAQQSGPLTGNGQIVKSGLGAWTITNTASTVAGGIRVNAGLVTFQGNSDPGENPPAPPTSSGPFGTGTLTLAGGTLHNFANSSLSNAVNVLGEVLVFTPGSVTTAYGLYLYGTVTMSGGSAITADPGSGAARRILGIMSRVVTDPSTGLVVSGRVQLGGQNSPGTGHRQNYTGETWVRSGTMHLGWQGTDDLLPTGSIVRLGSSAATGTLDLNWWFNTTSTNAASQTIAGLRTDGGDAGRFGSSVTNTHGSSSRVLTLDVPGTGTLDYSGTVGGLLSLVKSGVGSQTLSGTLSHTGGVSVTGGTLIVSGALPTGTFTGGLSVSSTGTLDLRTNFAIANGALSFTGGTFATRGPLDLGGTARNITVPATGTFYVGTGATSGTLVVGALTNTASGGAVVVEPGMTLSVSPAGTATFAGDTSGGGAITKAGAGTQTFSGTLNHTGGLRVAGGMAVFSGSVSTSYTGGTSVTASGALLRVVQPLLHPGTGSAVAGVSVAAGGTVEVSVAAETENTVLALRAGALSVGGTSGGQKGLVNLPNFERGVQPSEKGVVLDVQSLSISNNSAALGSRTYYGFVDLGDSDMVIRGGTSLSEVRDMVRAWVPSRGGASTAMTGLGSRLAGVLKSGPLDEYDDNRGADAFTTLAVRLNNSGFGFPEFSTFDGLTVSATDVLIKYTFYGDTDLDGLPSSLDYNKVLSGWTNGRTGWENGDSNYDDVVDATDFGLFAAAYDFALMEAVVFGRGVERITSVNTIEDALLWGEQRGLEYVPEMLGRAPSAVPEPAYLSLLCPAALLAGRVGRRRRR
jgi:fibronectin-binding autotransporter adhesin